jgi:AcrR family transcriptional regulator
MIELILDAPKERRDAAEHRRRILVAARTLFAEQGVDATNMTEIARAANIGQGTLYRRFAHKGELCEALLQENVLCFEREMEARFADDKNATSLDRLEMLFVQMMHFGEQNHPLLAAMIDSANGPRRGEFFKSPYYLWMHAMTVRLLNEGIAAGEIHELDSKLTAHLMIASFKGTIFCYQQKELGYSSEEIIRCIRGLLIEGLRTRE